jgi:membrane protein DedA with SNARE-associated domain
MQHPLEFLLRLGYPVLFGIVFAEQIGLPIPAIPLLLGMGALAGSGQFSLTTSLLVALCASWLADGVWYVIGRRKGYGVLAFLCRISLEPDACVSGTRLWFDRLGAWTLVIAKFVPGLSTVAPPLAGLSRMPWWLFATADAIGGLLWASAFLGLGYAFREQIEEVGAIAARLGAWLLALIVVLLALWILWKYRQRRLFIRKLRVARVSPEFVKEHLVEFVVLDLRTRAEVAWDGLKLPNAVWLDRQNLAHQHAQIPRDRDVVLYCT